jgi:hypothetical protein
MQLSKILIAALGAASLAIGTMAHADVLDDIKKRGKLVVRPITSHSAFAILPARSSASSRTSLPRSPRSSAWSLS